MNERDNNRDDGDSRTEAEEQSDTAFEAKAKALFAESVAQLDAATLSRLNRGRQEAIAELSKRRRSAVRWTTLVPAAGVAAAAVVAVVVWQGAPTTPDAPPPVADLEILLDEDGLEMLEDIEFYTWLSIDETALDSDQDADVS